MKTRPFAVTATLAAVALLAGGCFLAGPNSSGGTSNPPPTGSNGGLTGGGGAGGAGGFNAVPSCTVGPNAPSKPPQDASGLSLIDSDGEPVILGLLYVWCTEEPDEFELEMTLFVESRGSFNVATSRIGESIPGTIPSSYALQWPCSPGASYYLQYVMVLNGQDEPGQSLPARTFASCDA